MALFQDKTALVVGGSSGIGRAAAVAFAREGARVVVAARRKTEGQETVDLVEQAGSKGTFIATDVTDVSQVESLVNQTVGCFGGLHYAFNEAGSGVNKPVAEMSPEEWHADIAVNLDAVFYGLRYQIPAIIASGGGAIVNMSSQIS